METMLNTSCVSPSQLRLQYLLALDGLTPEELRVELRLPRQAHERHAVAGEVKLETEGAVL